MASEPKIGEPRRWQTISVTHYAQEETITKRTRVWEYYEARCVSAPTESEAIERLAQGHGARITGKRRRV